MADIDAIVVGAGPNGLVAANLLTDAGWRVLLLESQDGPGGAVRSAQITRPGFVHDLFSAFYPLAVASPVMRNLGLEAWGLRWRRAPSVVASPVGGGEWAAITPDLDETAGGFDRLARGDGDAWRRFYRRWERLHPHLIDAITTPFPPVRAGAHLAARLGPDLLSFLRFALTPLRRMAMHEFAGQAPGLVIAGNAMHADNSPDEAGSGLFGWLMSCLAQQVGFPVPEGGAQSLTNALVARFQAGGGTLRCRSEVTRIVVRNGRATGVRLQDGTEIAASRAILADVSAPALYGRLVEPEHLPARVLEQMRRFQFDPATVKVDWAIQGSVPWESKLATSAGTIHLCESMDHFARVMGQIVAGRVPEQPLLVVGQMTVADESRSPPGTESIWAYAHAPRHVRETAGGEPGPSDGRLDVAAFAEQIQSRIEQHAPGFGDTIIDRHVQGPADLEAADANLVGGAINGGTARLHQQLVFRPVPGLARAETPIRGLYLASASAHPGGGVHGACGGNAARAALAAVKRRRVFAASASAIALAAGSKALRPAKAKR